MAEETAPASSQSDGRRRIWFVPTGSNPLSVAILKAATAKDMTYSFTPDGWARSVAQATVVDKRLTKVRDLSRPGKVTEGLDVKYVESVTPGSADVVLVEGIEGFFVERRGIANATDPTVGQLVDVLTILAGIKRPDAPTENGIDTISQGMYLTDSTRQKVALVA